MCLAIPARVIELRPPDQAVVDLGGVRKTISVALVPDTRVDDYVVVHVGFAIGRVDPDEARHTLALFAEMSDAGTEHPADANLGPGAGARE